jgi:hypothetical protein
MENALIAKELTTTPIISVKHQAPPFLLMASSCLPIHFRTF